MAGEVSWFVSDLQLCCSWFQWKTCLNSLFILTSLVSDFWEELVGMILMPLSDKRSANLRVQRINDHLMFSSNGIVQIKCLFCEERLIKMKMRSLTVTWGAVYSLVFLLEHELLRVSPSVQTATFNSSFPACPSFIEHINLVHVAAALQRLRLMLCSIIDKAGAVKWSWNLFS